MVAVNPQPLLWLHIASDVSIVFFYLLTSFFIIYLLRKRESSSFKPVLWMFLAVLANCGITHLMDVWSVWRGSYRLSEILGSVTALISFSASALIAAFILKNKSAGKLLENEVRERIRAENDLEAQRVIFQGLFQYAPEGLIVIGSDGKINFVNMQVQKMFDYSSEELTGKQIEVLIPERFRSGHVNSRNSYFKAPTTLAPGNRADLYGCRKDGTEFPVDIILAPMKTGEQQVVLATVRDITERKKTEQMQKRLVSIVESSNDAIFSIDLKGTIQSWNQSAEVIYGYTSDEAIGASFEKLFPKEKKDEYTKTLDNLERGKAIKFPETTRVRKDGISLAVSIAVSPIHDHTRKVVGASVIHRDVTEQKRSHEQLERLLKEKEVLLKEIHHRVRNNLQSVASLLQMQAHETSDPKIVQRLKESQDRIRTMATLHQSLYQSNLESINFADYLSNLVDHLFHSYVLGTDQINVTQKVDDVHLKTETALPCTLIVNELLTNSLKYAFPQGKKGEIEIFFGKKDEKHYLLEVKDNGVGLPKGFDLKKSKTLGLQLVHALTQQLHGKIEIHSGHGTHVTMTFPIPKS